MIWTNFNKKVSKIVTAPFTWLIKEEPKCEYSVPVTRIYFENNQCNLYLHFFEKEILTRSLWKWSWMLPLWLAFAAGMLQRWWKRKTLATTSWTMQNSQLLSYWNSISKTKSFLQPVKKLNILLYMSSSKNKQRPALPLCLEALFLMPQLSPVQKYCKIFEWWH